ncbi:hypothetical protein, variant 1 [Aphanomyces invadans]|uniref:Serine aminopeptidase S33 domain-containing protein n=1 Tax=Aphanomyces invadans TaxID=157072 RepID=A0A024U4V7_9STRA|nr:hypothetical protein, variant 1 [Aphanomyces invadans]ETW01294.1 hypothetical protein, variant 1 [Aphanomyces invadans]|eukprot:XP_008870292.1 hypothetical protein, variant 1 [Aphanomyces invadans]
MGGVAGSLFMLWVRSGFSSATVASALTFFPPSPTYGLVKQADGATAVDHYIDANVPFSSTASLAVVRTKRGQEIPCFVFRHPEATFTMIYSHGNATDCGGMFLRYLSLSRVNVVGYDYTGYGGASGSPSEADTYADITAIYDHVVAHICTSSDPAKEIILYGQSVGSGPSIYLATERPVRGLIVHSGLLSGMRVLTSNRCLACLDIYPNVDRIQNVTCRTLIIHGVDDMEIPIAHGHGLHQALPVASQAEPYWVPDRGHNDIGETATCRPGYVQHLAAFLKTL